jgi:hypothetical protein
MLPFYTPHFLPPRCKRGGEVNTAIPHLAHQQQIIFLSQVRTSKAASQNLILELMYQIIE